MNRKEWQSERWSEQDGVIYLSVTSDGTTGPQWMSRFEKQSYCLLPYTRYVLCSSDFKPTIGITTKIAILKGTLFMSGDRSSRNIRDWAMQRELSTPNAEIACLVRAYLSDYEIEAMGLFSIITMHEPIVMGYPWLLVSSASPSDNWFSTLGGQDSAKWSMTDGFVFAS